MLKRWSASRTGLEPLVSPRLLLAVENAVSVEAAQEWLKGIRGPTLMNNVSVADRRFRQRLKQWRPAMSESGRFC